MPGAAAPVNAQASDSRSGRLDDQQGAVVPGATDHRCASHDTNRRAHGRQPPATQAAGSLVTNLPAGNYAVDRRRLSGLHEVRSDPASRLALNQDAVIDVTLTSRRPCTEHDLPSRADCAGPQHHDCRRSACGSDTTPRRRNSPVGQQPRRLQPGALSARRQPAEQRPGWLCRRQWTSR